MVSSAVLAASLAVLAPPGPQTPLAVAKSMAASYAKSIRAKDVAWFAANSTPDFSMITAQGRKEDRAALLAGAKSGFAGMKSTPQVTVSVVSARRAEGGVLALQNSHVSAKVDFGKPQLSTVDSKTQEEVLYVPKGKGWLVKRIKTLKDATLIDGKAFGAG